MPVSRGTRWWFGVWIASAFAGGSYVAFTKVPDMLYRLRHPAQPAAHKPFVPPPPPTVVTVDAPDLSGEKVAPMKPVKIPGIELPPR